MENKILKVTARVSLGLCYAIPIIMSVDCVDALVGVCGRKVCVVILGGCLCIAYLAGLGVTCNGQDRLMNLLKLHFIKIPLAIIGLIFEILLIGVIALHFGGFTPEMLD